MTSPDVTVVIPVRDDPLGLRRCLRALAEQSGSVTYEVIVADNGSRRPIEAVVDHFPFARMVSQPVGGSYAARNRGLEEVQTDIVAFTDSDCVPSPTWLVEGLTAISDPSVGLAAGRIDVFVRDPSRPRTAELYDVVHAFPQRRYAESLHFGATANVFTRQDVIAAVGPFDAALTSGGDKEWGTRVHASGFEVRYCADAVVAHPARATWAEHRRKLQRVLAGNRQLEWSRPERPLVVRVLPPVRGMARSRSDPRLIGARMKLQYAASLAIHRYLALWVSASAGRHS